MTRRISPYSPYDEARKIMEAGNTTGVKVADFRQSNNNAGLLTRITNIKIALRECLEHEQTIRSVLFGGGDEEGKAQTPPDNSIDGLSYDSLSMVSSLRDRLEGMACNLTGDKVKKVSHG